jgi:hypothetical protein
MALKALEGKNRNKDTFPAGTAFTFFIYAQPAKETAPGLPKQMGELNGYKPASGAAAGQRKCL